MNLVLAFTNLSIVKSILLLTSIVKSIVLHTESDLARHCFAWFPQWFVFVDITIFSLLLDAIRTHTYIHTYILLFHVPWGFSLKYDKIRLVLRY